MPYIGQPIAWTPCAYCNLDGKENPKSTRERTKVHGKIVWINELHHFFSWRHRSAGTRCVSVSSFEAVKKVDSKCYMCEDRHPACQDKCPDYLAWKANLDANKAKIADERKKFEDINSYQRDTAGRLYKKK